jgi:hypothetical protein
MTDWAAEAAKPSSGARGGALGAFILRYELLLSLLIVVISIWTPRVLSLERYVTPDEHLWLTRSANFYFALGQREFIYTYQRQHPGVTIMWAGTAGFLWRYPEYRGSGQGQINYTGLERYLKDKPVTAIELLAAGRFFMVLGNTLALSLAYLFARRLIGRGPALIGFLLIAFDPFHVAHTRLLHLDGMLGSWMLLSLLSFMSYWRTRRSLDLLVSGAAAGLSWLTKSPGLFLVPTAGLLALGEMVRAYRAGGGLRAILRSYLWPSIAWGVVGMLTFVVLWPSMWVDPLGNVRRIVGMANSYAEEGHASSVFYNGVVYTDGSIGPEVVSFYPTTFLWRTTPPVLAGLLLLGVFLLRRQRRAWTGAAGFALLGLLLHVLIFTLVMNMGGKKFDRYLLPAYAPLDLMAGLGWAMLLAWLPPRLGRIPRAAWAAGVLAGVIGLQAGLTASTYPYYLSYYNPLLGGSARAPQVMQIGWGEGLDQAARYLNQKPGLDNLRVSSWYAIGSFSYFFHGKAQYIHAATDLRETQWEKVLDADYAVIYVHQWQRRIPEKLLEQLSTSTPEYSVWINGIEYVRIYDLKKLPAMP